MDYTELLAKQGFLAEIYNRRKREYKLKKDRDARARARALKEIKQAGQVLREPSNVSF